MPRHPRRKPHSYGAWFLFWLAASATAHGLFLFAQTLVPYRMSFGEDSFAAPEPVSDPWYWGAGWALPLGFGGLTALALWFDRQERSYEPLALVALCLAVLGFHKTAQGMSIAGEGCWWPVNLVHVGLGMLAAAGLLASLAWLRVLRARPRRRGRIIAVCVLFCCAGWGGIVFHAYGNLFPWVDEPPARLAPALEGIDLPVTERGRHYRPDPEDGLHALTIRADGTAQAQGEVIRRPGEPPELLHDWLARTAASMARDEEFTGQPGEALLVVADRCCTWADVEDVFEYAGWKDVYIWKVQLLTRWEEPAVLTIVALYLPKEIGTHHPPEDWVPPSILSLRVTAEGTYVLGDEPLQTRDALLQGLDACEARLREPSRRAWPELTLRIEPDEGAPWESVVTALEVVWAVGVRWPTLRVGTRDIDLLVE